jgi:hypothetical protein
MTSTVSTFNTPSDDRVFDPHHYFNEFPPMLTNLVPALLLPSAVQVGQKENE